MTPDEHTDAQPTEEQPDFLTPLLLKKSVIERWKEIANLGKFKSNRELLMRVFVDMAYSVLKEHYDKEPEKYEVFTLLSEVAPFFSSSAKGWEEAFTNTEYETMKANKDPLYVEKAINEHLDLWEVKNKDEVLRLIHTAMDSTAQYLIQKDSTPVGVAYTIPLNDYMNVVYDPANGIALEHKTKEGKKTAQLIAFPIEFLHEVDMSGASLTTSTSGIFFIIRVMDEIRFFTRKDLIEYLLHNALVEISPNRMGSVVGVIAGTLVREKEGFYIPIKGKVISGAGVWPDENGDLKLKLTLSDGVVPLSPEHYVVSMKAKEAYDRLKRAGDEELKYTLRVVLEILKGFGVSPWGRINTILAMGHLGISPFFKVLMDNYWIAKFLLLYGEAGSGKTLKLRIIQQAYGDLINATGDAGASLFRFQDLLSQTTFPILWDEVTKISEDLIHLTKAVAGGGESKRGTPSQRMNKKPYLTTFMMTTNDLDWEALFDRGVPDRWVIGRNEQKKMRIGGKEVSSFKNRRVRIKRGNRYEVHLLSDLDGVLLVDTVAWGLDYLERVTSKLNEEAHLELNTNGSNALMRVLSSLTTSIEKVIQENPKLNGYEKLKEIRFLRTLAMYYFGLNAVASYFEDVLGKEEFEEHKKELDWLFELTDLEKFVNVMVTDWLAYTYNVDVLKSVLEEIDYFLSSDTDPLRRYPKDYQGTVIEDEYGGVVRIKVKASFFKQYQRRNKSGGYATLKDFAVDFAKYVQARKEELGLPTVDWKDYVKEIAGKDGKGKTIRVNGKITRAVVIPRDEFEIALGIDPNEVVDEPWEGDIDGN